MLTDAQREAARDRIVQALIECDALGSPYAAEVIAAIRRADAALDALLSDHVVLHRDDVKEERRPPVDHPHRGVYVAGQTRLVTRWEPITNTEDTDA